MAFFLFFFSAHSIFFIIIKIFIKTLTGRKQPLNVEPSNQVLIIKQLLQEKEGIQVDQIKLIYSGRQLADDKTLESYNITAGATIHMVLQLRGGGISGGGVDRDQDNTEERNITMTMILNHSCSWSQLHTMIDQPRYYCS
jgi:hypothetical protein